jgi:HK97 gp10 family phage protein
MNFRAQSTFKAGDFSRLEALLVPKLLAGAQAAADIVYEESQVLVPVDTGELHDTADTSVEWTGKTVQGYVVYPAPYAAYVEFGTGRRGAASAGAGPYPYSESWAGMVAQPYLRPALDTTRGQVLAAFKEALGV